MGAHLAMLTNCASANCRVPAKAAPCRQVIPQRSGEMSDQRWESAVPVEPYFDRTPQPFGEGPVEPLVYDAAPQALRQRTVNFGAKRLADMRYVSGLDRTTAERHFRWRPAVAPGGLGFRAAPDAGRGGRRASPRRHRHRDGRCRSPGHGALERPRLRRTGRRRRARPARLWRDRPRTACEPAIRSAAGFPDATGARARLAARRCSREADSAALNTLSMPRMLSLKATRGGCSLPSQYARLMARRGLAAAIAAMTSSN